jgi:2,4-dienoyl-CoA reductase-like NADH-dependent reductase (Old Yellow Enzyme family)
MIVATVGGVQSPEFANEVIEKNEADLVVIARAHLRDPYFSIHAAQKLNYAIDIPWQYKRAF